MNEYKAELGVKWIKTDAGNTYLCPVDAVSSMSNPTDEHLRKLCVDESRNPQND